MANDATNIEIYGGDDDAVLTTAYDVTGATLPVGLAAPAATF